ncbi:MAG: hypothetical protein E8D50_07435 [Nitrospira sp.]|nr:MAG: hypothetical protein E8D50_07435 [Nitrospira sp.]
MSAEQCTVPLIAERTVPHDIARTGQFEATAASTFLTSFLVVILGTAAVDPVRLPLLVIPISFLLAAYGIGQLLERAAQFWTAALPTHLSMLALTARLGMGISILGFSATILGLLGLYRFTWPLIAIGLTWSLWSGLKYFTQWRWQQIRPTSASFLSGIAMGIVWCIVWLWSTIPPTFYDELAYHLPIAQYALRTGFLPALPWSFFTYMPHLSDLLLGWGLALGGDVGARSMHLVFWVVIWVAGWGFIETLTTPERTPWIGCLIAGAFASSSTFLFLGALPFAETSLTFAVLASAALIALPIASVPWLPVGLLWGLAISVKLSGLSWVIAGAVAALAMGWSMKSIFKAGLAAVVMALPWWGRAWWLTGNPLYPLGYRWLGGLYWNEDSQARLQGDLPSLAEPFDIMTILRLPFDMVLAPERFGSASDCGPLAVGAICLVLSLPLWTVFLHLDQARRRQCYAVGLFVFLTAAVWVMTSTTTRFLAPALMLALSLLAALLTKTPKVIFAISIVILTALGTWGTSRFVSMHSLVFSSGKVALGQEPGAEYAKRTVDYYEAATFVKEHLPPDAKLLFIGESRPFYFDRTSLAPYPFHEHPLTQWIREATSLDQLRDRLRDEGFTHVILNTREFKRLHDKYQVLAFSGPNALLYDQHLKQLPRTMTTLFSKNGVYIFEIPSSP